MPRYFMLQDGIKPEILQPHRLFRRPRRDRTWVQTGRTDGGVLNASVWEKLVAANTEID
jgi:phosphonate transport system substrate-binding protein